MKQPNEPPRKNFPLLSLGFLRPILRKRLSKIGYFTVWPWTKPLHCVCVWGMRAPAIRGIKFAKKHNLPLYFLEDGFIRSLEAGWKEPPLSLRIDENAAYFDATRKAGFFALLGDREFSDEDIEDYIAWQSHYGISKYNTQSRGDWVEKDYILVVDQKRDDASIHYGGAQADDFALMLKTAQSQFPNDKIIIKPHPAGAGYFDQNSCENHISLLNQPINIWDLLTNAKAVFVVTSQMGFESILAGHRPWVFGKPFYSGLGLSHDMKPHREPQNFSKYDLYEAFMLRSTYWFNNAGELSNINETLMAIEARRKAAKLARAQCQFLDLSPWKTPYFRKIFPNQGQKQPIRWGEKHHQNEWIIEDGFLRSQGLGAKLTPPISLVIDKTGIYFDPTGPSDLENWVLSRKNLYGFQKQRIHNLLKMIKDNHLSKYNLGEFAHEKNIPPNAILVVGQVEDDRSVKLGATGDVQSNADLLKAARRDFPNAFLIYKPHPDVQSGLRKGKFNADDLADWVYEGDNIAALWDGVERVITLSSLAGFEALIRGKIVTCYGAPFYAGWGLTDDRAPTPKRRSKVEFETLAYAALIDYPIYYDPILHRQTTPEIAIRRLAEDHLAQPVLLRILTKFQQNYYKFLRFFESKTSSIRK